MVIRFLLLFLAVTLVAELVLAQPQLSWWRQALRAERLQTKLTQGLAKLTQGGKKTLATTLVAVTLALSAPVPSLVAQDWQRVTSRSEEHLKSTFYLLLDAGDLWRVMHIGYLGPNEDDKPLFVGLRTFTIIRNAKGVERDILNKVEASLVGYNGLIKQGVEIKVEEVFPRPERPFLDLIVFTLAGVDMSEHEPIKVELWPMKLLTELEMLSYRIDLANNELGFFSYPAMRRSCVAGNFFVNQGTAMHTCVVPHNPASISSPIFVKENGALVALQIGYNEDGLPYAVAAPPELVDFSNATLAVSAKQKTATRWGEIKSAHE